MMKVILEKTITLNKLLKTIFCLREQFRLKRFVDFLSCEKNTYFNKIEDITDQSVFKTGKQLNYFHKQPL